MKAPATAHQRKKLLERYADMRPTAENHGDPDLPTQHEVEWRRSVCDTCEHIVRTDAGLACAKCPTCPKGRRKRILFTLLIDLYRPPALATIREEWGALATTVDWDAAPPVVREYRAGLLALHEKALGEPPL
ncbi:MAG: hypothetical protein J7M19_08210, partial [Planctomycetes bacterium]|nr:hypothetical protein [Planctomycetota bacterium]